MAQVLPYPGEAERAGHDADIVEAAARGDRRAFERLYRRHAPEVHGLCLRMTGRRDVAEDCTQEAFIAAWRALPRFESRSRFSTWLHRIAVNAVLARRRGLAAAPDAAIDLQSFSGDIGNCFGPKPVTSDYGPGSRLMFGSGSGGGGLRVNTKSGNITLCTRAPRPIKPMRPMNPLTRPSAPQPPAPPRPPA